MLPGNMANHHHRVAWMVVTLALILTGSMIMLIVSEVAADLAWPVMANPNTGVCVGYTGGIITGMTHPYQDGTCPIPVINWLEFKYAAENPANPNTDAVLVGFLVLASGAALMCMMARDITVAVRKRARPG